MNDLPIKEDLVKMFEDEVDNHKSDDLLSYMIWLTEFMGLHSKENKKTVSNSEVRRWIKNGSILINGKRPTSIDWKIDFPITQLVLFPKGKSRCTLI